MLRFAISSLLSISLSIVAAGCGGPAMWVMSKVIDSNMRTDFAATLPDGLHALICGAGGPFADPERSGPCVAIIAGKTIVVVDSGSGAARNLMRLGLSPGEVEDVFLTHFHSDHIDGLGEMGTLRWANSGSKTPLPVHGPIGVEEVVDGFNAAYRQDQAYRNTHHGEAIMPMSGWGLEARAFALPAQGKNVVVFDRDGLVIRSFAVDHSPVSPAVGYRFDYKGRSIVVSGDTSKSNNLIAQAKGVDLLIHDGLSPKLVGLIHESAVKAGNTRLAKIMTDIPGYHASPVDAAESAQEAGADFLLFYHVVPPLPISSLEEIYLEGVRKTYEGRVEVAVDGTFISLPAGSKRIKAYKR